MINLHVDKGELVGSWLVLSQREKASHVSRTATGVETTSELTPLADGTILSAFSSGKGFGPIRIAWRLAEYK